MIPTPASTRYDTLENYKQNVTHELTITKLKGVNRIM